MASRSPRAPIAATPVHPKEMGSRPCKYSSPESCARSMLRSRRSKGSIRIDFRPKTSKRSRKPCRNSSGPEAPSGYLGQQGRIGKAMTGEPDARDPQVRFWGRGGANQCAIPTSDFSRPGLVPCGYQSLKALPLKHHNRCPERETLRLSRTGGLNQTAIYQEK